jgi:hypothetical protein
VAAVADSATLPPGSPVAKYLDLISGYENEFKKWFPRVRKLLKKYRDESRTDTSNESARFNILWSNVQTLIPAVYARTPKADVSRRFVDTDPIGRVASLLIERSLDYEIEHYSDFRSAMTNCVGDRFLGGRGVAWVRYEPHVVTQCDQVTEDVADPQDATTPSEQEPQAAKEPQEEVEYECSPCDYVHWQDFGHSSARTWEEVTAVWRWVYMSEDAAKKRFGKKAKNIAFNTGPQRLDQSFRTEVGNTDKAKICELWDKETGKVVWFDKNAQDFLDECDDPLELEGFFPCPKPLYATVTTDSLVPVPDYSLYQDQANELDIISDRIDGLIKALRVRGVYDASQPVLQRLLTEGENNSLVGNDKWAQFSEKGGLKGSIDILPLEIFANALMQCYQARENVKSQVYEITGISDIVRGTTAASETATAQEIKGQYAGLRLKSMQETVAMFASEMLRIKAQIICSKYQDHTILAYAAAQQMSPEDQAMIPAALQLIRNKPLNSFRIDVAADSLVQIDEQQIKQDRLEFLNATSNFLREAVPAGQQTPELVPAIMGMIKFGIAGFKQARTLEGTFDAALQKLEQKAAQMAANPPPNPEVQKAQAKAQADAQAAQMQAQAASQVEQMRAQSQQAVEQMKMQGEAQLQLQQQQAAAQLEQIKLQMNHAFQKWEAELKATTTIQVALIQAGQPMNGGPIVDANTDASKALMQLLSDGLTGISLQMDQRATDVNNHTAALEAQHAQHRAQMHAALQMAAGPKRIVRGPDGRAIGVEPVQPTMQ